MFNYPATTLEQLKSFSDDEFLMFFIAGGIIQPLHNMFGSTAIMHYGSAIGDYIDKRRREIRARMQKEYSQQDLFKDFDANEEEYVRRHNYLDPPCPTTIDWRDDLAVRDRARSEVKRLYAEYRFARTWLLKQSGCLHLDKLFGDPEKKIQPIKLEKRACLEEARVWMASSELFLTMVGEAGFGKSLTAAWIMAKSFPEFQLPLVRQDAQYKVLADFYTNPFILGNPWRNRYIKATILAVPQKDEYWLELLEAPLLIIDDLGMEHKGKSEWAVAKVNELICEREERLNKTLITSNLSEKKIAEDYGGRVIDRLKGFGHFYYYKDSHSRTKNKEVKDAIIK